MNTIKVFLLSLAVAGIAACSADDDDPVTDGLQQPLPLTITVDENPLLNPDASSQAPATRTAVTTTASLTAFTLDYQYIRSDELQYGKNSVKKDVNGNWSAGYWPTSAADNTPVSWYAHTDGTIVNQTDPYLNFAVEELATSQKDLLVASTSGTKAETLGRLTLTFDHACTALRFYVKKAKNLDDHTLTVTSIKLCNVVKDGRYYFRTSSWTPGSTRTPFTLYEGTGMTLPSTDYTLLNASDDDYLFIIPQTLTAWDTTTAIASASAQTYIQLQCSIDGGSTYSGLAYIPFAATLEAGIQHDVTINIGKNSLYSGPNTKIIN